MSEPLLEVRDLHVEIPTSRGRRRTPSTARRSRSRPGEALGLVGESGCGKTMTLRAILRPARHGRRASSAARSLFDGVDLAAARTQEPAGASAAARSP